MSGGFSRGFSAGFRRVSVEPPPAGSYASARSRPRVVQAPERIRAATARERPRTGSPPSC